MRKTVVADIVNNIVPISRFNKGEANKIFEEVNRDGVKVVMKNNDPSCVLVSMDKYLEMEEMLENFLLIADSEAREQNYAGKKTISHQEIMTRYGLCEADLNAGDVEIE